MKTQDLIVVVSVGLMLGAIGKAKLDRTPDEPAPEPPAPAASPRPDEPKPALAVVPKTPQDESEAMKAWKARKAALNALGASVKSPDQVWSPIDDTRSIARFYKLPAKVQSNMWNHVYKQKSEVMAKFMAYMEAQNALDAQKPLR